MVTWLLQRGRCAWCSCEIPPFYVLVEAFCAIQGALIAWGWLKGFWTNPVDVACFAVFALLAVPISLIDWERFEIPDSLVTIAGLGGLVSRFVFSDPTLRMESLLDGIKGALLAAGFLYGIYFFSRVGLGAFGGLVRRMLRPSIQWHWRRGIRRDLLVALLRWARFHPEMEALGLGDVSLGLAAGACLGATAVIGGLAPAAGLGALGFMYRRSNPIHQATAEALGADPHAIPFGPFLCAGFLLVSLAIRWGLALPDWVR